MAIIVGFKNVLIRNWGYLKDAKQKNKDDNLVCNICGGRKGVFSWSCKRGLRKGERRRICADCIYEKINPDTKS